MNIRLGKILGIPIKIDMSWLVIFALITYSLGNSRGYFRTEYPTLSPGLDWLGGIAAALLLFASVLLHELMHSYVAKKNGLPVGGITLFIFGGVSELMKEPTTPEIEFKMALAGPLTSIVLGAVLLFLAWAAHGSRDTLGLAIAHYLGFINVTLGIFNMIPGFPLDGGRVLRAILWKSLNSLDRATRIAANIGQGFGYLFIVGGVFMLFSGLGWNGIWIAFIGWFLNNAAQQSYQQVELRRSLSGVAVQSVMTTDFPHVDPTTTLDELVHDYLLRYDFPAFPVSSGDSLVGIVTVSEVENVPRDLWHTTTVHEIAKPLEAEAMIDEDDDAFDALIHMAQGKSGRLVVMHEGKLKGIVTRESIINIVRRKLELGM